MSNDNSNLITCHPNKNTLKALNEYAEMKLHHEKYNHYSSFKEAMEEILAKD